MGVDIIATRTRLDQLRKAQRDVEQQIREINDLVLKNLPREYGFGDMDEFIFSLARFSSTALRKRIGAGAEGDPGSKKKGFRYGPDARVRVHNALLAGKRPSDISRREGIPLATIARWRKKFGIGAKKRGKRRGTGGDPLPVANGHAAV
jgi:hypothetical protein